MNVRVDSSDNSQKRGLVERRRDSADRRFVTVHLTDKGQALIQRVFPRHVSAVLEAMRALDASGQALLGDLCRTLGRAAAD